MSWANLFKMMDRDGSGQLHFGEFQAAVRQTLRLKTSDVAEKDLKRMWMLIDNSKNIDGQLTVKEMSTALSKFSEDAAPGFNKRAEAAQSKEGSYGSLSNKKKLKHQHSHSVKKKKTKFERMEEKRQANTALYATTKETAVDFETSFKADPDKPAKLHEGKPIDQLSPREKQLLDIIDRVAKYLQSRMETRSELGGSWFKLFREIDSS